MILPSVLIPEEVNKVYYEIGVDSYERCMNKNHFNNYPDKIIYEFNSRGFRDTEWPDVTELKDCIWCFGDSYTVGIGQSFDNIWVQKVQQETGIRVISVSINGASNQWISRKAIEVANTIKPKNIVLMWSYANRREKENADLSDYDRRVWFSRNTTELDDLVDFNKCLDNVLNNINDSNLIQLTIPNPGSKIIKDRIEELKNLKFLGEVSTYDFARDKYHFGNKTAQSVANKIIPLLTT